MIPCFWGCNNMFSIVGSCCHLAFEVSAMELFCSPALRDVGFVILIFSGMNPTTALSQVLLFDLEYETEFALVVKQCLLRWPWKQSVGFSSFTILLFFCVRGYFNFI
ncbi:Uncharacterized protein TCM_016919 [Theobroma cacao]|uniref:Uncharacterized protein n=1 Tax=Theobroma cacao TaxID=3641 RepID=A0A061EDF4_THECC|nr:Uncharacterized protein TCM_016919 [Theobroma cacao]